MTGTRPPASAKIVIAGGFGAGKTTFVGSVSEIVPLTTEAAMTEAASAVDDAAEVASKTTTTVAMDFGRITIDRGLVLYLFGTPGQNRFAFMWDDIALGSLGAIVLVDTRRLEDCYPAIDYFETRDIPFIVALNDFPGSEIHPEGEIRDALGVGPAVPIVRMDARDRAATKAVLLALINYLMNRIRENRGRVLEPAVHP